MPEYHGMRHFKHGITAVSQWTGRELKEMAKILLPVTSDAGPRVVRAARALLDFVYLAHSSPLSDTELDSMDEALRIFHQLKDVFKEEEAVTTEKAFHGIPKIHMISHYVRLIREFGTPDGYNTETSERLHIDFAKMGYRASNKVKARVEAIEMHAAYLEETQGVPDDDEGGADDRDADDRDEWDEWYEEEEEEDPEELRDAGVRVELATKLEDFPHADDPPDQHPRFHPVPECVLAKTPTTSGVTLSQLARTHGADQLSDTLHDFLEKEHPDRNARLPPGLKLNVWSRARLFHSPPPFKPYEGPHIDIIRAQPVKIDRFQRVRSACTV
ncbi:hypothetical protein FRC10_010291 [Ceratobasidium sp. 414]|nr:hypothetical protein FRC10_010291 [Ceratobasidium sp. 414]